MSHLKAALITMVVVLVGTTGFIYLTYTSLQNDYQNLESSYTSLQSSYTDTLNEISALSSEVDNLQSYVNSFQLEVNSIQDNLQQAQSQIDVVEKRTNPTSTQKESYVTPDDPAVVDRVAALGGTGQWDWSIARDFLDWVVANIEYESDPEIPNPYDYGATTRGEWYKYPSETLSEGCGDCEDLAILLASMLRANGGVGTYVLTVYTQDSGHALVITRVEGQNAAIWDPAYRWDELVTVEITCEHCHGDGEITCDHCNGTGKMACSGCSGTGEISCWYCGGDGECSLCGGDGVWWGTTCSWCGGSGKCSNCGGTGLMDCYWCDGTGEQDCWYCGGDGKNTCPYCWGSGTVTSWEWVERGYYDYGNYSTVWSEYNEGWRQWTPAHVFNDTYFNEFNNETEFLNWLA